jgi:hypothetical protein
MLRSRRVEKCANYASNTRNSDLFKDDGRLGEFEGDHDDVPGCMHVFATTRAGSGLAKTANTANRHSAIDPFAAQVCRSAVRTRRVALEGRTRPAALKLRLQLPRQLHSRSFHIPRLRLQKQQEPTPLPCPPQFWERDSESRQSQKVHLMLPWPQDRIANVVFQSHSHQLAAKGDERATPPRLYTKMTRTSLIQMHPKMWGHPWSLTVRPLDVSPDRKVQFGTRLRNCHQTSSRPSILFLHKR